MLERFGNSRAAGIHASRLSCLLILCIALGSCAASTSLLNSDRIAAKYGSYVVDVLAQDDKMRISSLASRHEGKAVTRTLAIVLFEPAPPAFADVHRRILAGASIGSSFRDAGWTIAKPPLFVGTLDVPVQVAPVASLMDISLPATLSMHAYWFTISRNGSTHRYARIIELHHPDYLSATALQAIVGPVNEATPGSDESGLRALASHVLSELPPVAER